LSWIGAVDKRPCLITDCICFAFDDNDTSSIDHTDLLLLIIDIVCNTTQLHVKI
jgi:hypothetical protein